MSHQSDSTGRYTTEHANPPRPAEPRSDTASIGGAEAPDLAHHVSTTLKPMTGERRSPTSTPASTPVRPLGMQSILNPPADNVQGSADHGLPSTRPPPHMLSPRSRKRVSPASPTRDFVTGSAQPRRMLTPKSPTLRAVSLGATLLPSIHAMSGATPQPLPAPSEPRVYTAEPGMAGVPALPPITATQRPYPPIQSNSTQRHPTQGQTASMASAYSASSLGGENRDASVSRHVQNVPEYLSPTLRHNKAPPPLSSGETYSSQNALSGFKTESMGRAGGDGYRPGQSSYQMTLETDQGPMVVPVELDLLQASKVADEKRKRNAGASARFRARRKEKEKEASHTIASLKHDIEELRAQRDFYREERDVIRDFAVRHVAIPLPIRPSSPISYHGADEAPDSPDGKRSRSDSGPAQRRRTEEYQQPTHSPLRTDQPTLHDYGRSFLPQPGATLHPSPQGAGSYRPLREVHPVTSGPPPLGSRSQSSYDLFRREPFERSWDQSR